MSYTSEHRLQELCEHLKHAKIARFLSAGGFVALLYDIALTLDDEIAYVWRQEPSFSKKLYLTNKYVVTSTLFFVAIVSNNYDNIRLGDTTCVVGISLAFICGILSIAAANLLVIMRVVKLWDKNKSLRMALFTVFAISFAANLIVISLIVTHYHNNYGYSTYTQTCYVGHNSPVLPGLWATSLSFEAVVLISVIWNAAYKPRKQSETLRAVLLYDGFLYFGSLTIIRILIMVMTIVLSAGMAFAVISLFWPMITIILSRSTIEISKAAAKELEELPILQDVSSAKKLHFYTNILKAFATSNDATALVSNSSRLKDEVGLELPVLHAITTSHTVLPSWNSGEASKDDAPILKHSPSRNA